MQEAISLEKAKQACKTDQLFISKNGDRFTMPAYGKYMPGIVFEFRNSFTKTFAEDQGRDGEYVHPVRFLACRELTDGMNMDWDGQAKAAFGTFRRSKNGNPVFTITDPKEATRVLVRVDWGGAFTSTRGQRSDYKGAQEAEFFRRASSNGGGTGYDYYVLPVDYMLDGPGRDVSQILQKLSDRIRSEELGYEQDHKAFLADKREHEAQTAQYDDKIRGLIDEYKSRYLALVPDAEFRLNEETTATGIRRYALVRNMSDGIYDQIVLGGITASEEGARNIQKAFDDMGNAVREREVYQPEMDALLAAGERYGISAVKVHLNGDHFTQYIRIDNARLKEIMVGHYGGQYQSYEFNASGCSRFRECLTSYIEEERKKQEEAKATILRDKVLRENEKKDKEAKEAGYPSDFTYFHREAGKTGQSIAVVVDSKGMRRYNDRNELRNKNHRHHYSDEAEMIVYAEGTQSWDQIRKGEAVFAFTKDDSKSPLVFHDIWMPDTLTEAQKEGIVEIAEEYAANYGTGIVNCGDDNREPLSGDGVIRVCEEHIRTQNRKDREQSSLAYIRELFPEEDPALTDSKIYGCGQRCLALLASDGSVMQALTQEQYRDGSPLVCGNAAAVVLSMPHADSRTDKHCQADMSLGRQADSSGRIDTSRRGTTVNADRPAGVEPAKKQAQAHISI